MTPAEELTILYNFDFTTGSLPKVTLIQHTFQACRLALACNGEKH